MTHDGAKTDDDAGLPGLHQGDAGGDLGRDHQARVERAVRLSRSRASTTCGPAAVPIVATAEMAGDGRAGGDHRRRGASRCDPPRKLVQTWRALLHPGARRRGADARSRGRSGRGRAASRDSRSPTSSRMRRSTRRRSRARCRSTQAVAAGPGSSATSRRCSSPASRPAGSERETAEALRAPGLRRVASTKRGRPRSRPGPRPGVRSSRRRCSRRSGSAPGTSGWLRMRGTSSTTLCWRVRDREPVDVLALAASRARLPTSVNPSGPSCGRLEALLASRPRITSSVKNSMPQFVWWMTNHSRVPSSL